MLCYHNLPAAYSARASGDVLCCDVQRGSRCNYHHPYDSPEEARPQASGVCRCGNVLATKKRKLPHRGHFCGCMYGTCDEFTNVPMKDQEPVTEAAAYSERHHRITIPLSQLMRRGLLPHREHWPPTAVSASVLERDLMGVEYVVRNADGHDDFGGGIADEICA